MEIKHLPIVISAWCLGLPGLHGAAVTSITRTGGVINTITVGSEVYAADMLETGTSSGGGPVGGGPADLDGIGSVDDLDLDTAAGRDRTNFGWQTINFNGGLYQDTNGDGYDFFVFERGGNDILTVQAIFANDTFGQMITVASSNGTGWGATGFTDTQPIGGQLAYGAAFKITDLLDASGANLTNSSVIKGLFFSPPAGTTSTGVDPSVVVAVIPEPSAIGLTGIALLLLATRRSRKER